MPLLRLIGIIAAGRSQKVPPYSPYTPKVGAEVRHVAKRDAPEPEQARLIIFEIRILRFPDSILTLVRVAPHTRAMRCLWGKQDAKSLGVDPSTLRRLLMKG
jgi:hypothetical protein